MVDKYTIYKGCSKCGCNVTRDEYREFIFRPGGVIERKCSNCGYVWKEIPLDEEA